MPTGITSEGAEAIVDFFQLGWAAIPDITMTPRRVIDRPNEVAVE